jgi:hypothetical protein
MAELLVRHHLDDELLCPYHPRGEDYLKNSQPLHGKQLVRRTIRMHHRRNNATLEHFPLCKIDAGGCQLIKALVSYQHLA